MSYLILENRNLIITVLRQLNETKTCKLHVCLNIRKKLEDRWR